MRRNTVIPALAVVLVVFAVAAVALTARVLNITVPQSGGGSAASGGGSAASLAAFEAPLAIGTDTGGSIRQPAAVTGTVGIKPTYGGVSRYGVVALASSLDQVGPCARTVLDAALLHEVIAGHDPMDQTSIDAPVPAVVAAAQRGDVTGMRIGVVRELGGEGYQIGRAHV